MFYMRLKICCVGIIFLVPCITPRLSRIIQPGQFRANTQTRSGSGAKAVNVAVESTLVVNVIANYLCHSAGARSPPHVGAIIAAAAISIPYVQTPCMSPPPPPRRGGRGVARHGGCCRRRRRKHARRLHSPRHPCRWRLPQLTDCCCWWLRRLLLACWRGATSRPRPFPSTFDHLSCR